MTLEGGKYLHIFKCADNCGYGCELYLTLDYVLDKKYYPSLCPFHHEPSKVRWELIRVVESSSGIGSGQGDAHERLRYCWDRYLDFSKRVFPILPEWIEDMVRDILNGRVVHTERAVRTIDRMLIDIEHDREEGYDSRLDEAIEILVCIRDALHQFMREHPLTPELIGEGRRKMPKLLGDRRCCHGIRR